MRSVILAVVMLAIPLAPSQAQLSIVDGPVDANVLDVTDGDTLKFIGFPFPEQATRGRLRICCMDTPEINGKCADEKNKAELARLFVEDLVNRNGKRVKLYTIGLDGKGGGGFGRYLARVKVGSVWLDDELIRLGYARPNHGERRLPWCG
jgi:endonuclease YncB( thermonuclease family)